MEFHEKTNVFFAMRAGAGLSLSLFLCFLIWYNIRVRSGGPLIG